MAISQGWRHTAVILAAGTLGAGPVDFNGDGYADFALSADDGGREVLVYFGGPEVDDLRPGLRLTPPPGRRGHFGSVIVALPDRNGDGYSELAVSDGASQHVLVYRGSIGGPRVRPEAHDRGQWQPVRDCMYDFGDHCRGYAGALPRTDAVLIDVDEDGIDERARLGWDPLLGGRMTFELEREGALGWEPLLSLEIDEGTPSPRWGLEEGWHNHFYQPPGVIDGPRFADLDGDGRLDLFFVAFTTLLLLPRNNPIPDVQPGGHQLRVHFGTADGFRRRGLQLLTKLGLWGRPLSPGDIDGDGADDLVVRTSDGGAHGRGEQIQLIRFSGQSASDVTLTTVRPPKGLKPGGNRFARYLMHTDR